MSDLPRRAQAMRRGMEQSELGSLVIFGHENIRYLCGFSGSAGVLVVTQEELLLLSDSRYRLQAAEETTGVRFVEVEGRVVDSLSNVLAGTQGRVGVESSHLPVAEWRRLEPALGEWEYTFVDGAVERIRMVKDSREVAAIREAAEIALTAYDRLKEIPVVGREEREIALELELWVRRHGSEPVPFPFIVASGARGAMPHAHAGHGVIERGELLVVDLGATVDGYASDVTRTFATGKLNPELQTLHDLVVQAQAVGREAAGPGAACAAVDAAARAVIDEAGVGDLFKHGLGHGVGLEVHEAPTVGSRSEDVLEEGMVVTIEPGVYKPGIGGVRVEDTVVITSGGVDVLTEYERSAIRVG